MKALGDGFVKLIKMVITPIIFCTVVSGIAHISDAKKVRRVAVKTLVYFEVISTFALLIGLVIGNLVRPGHGFSGHGSAEGELVFDAGPGLGFVVSQSRTEVGAMDMTKVIAILLATGALLVPARADETVPRVSKQTILFIRHGEKPAAGLGQLNCKGLNRALALPAVLAARYGRIDAVYAPDPAKQKPDGTIGYDYVRPLATVEPTAIGLGLPIHADFGYDEIGKLRSALLSPDYRDKTILVGWEHNKLTELVPTMVSALGGDSKPMPWDKADFDSIWRVTIEWSDGKVHATLDPEKEGLDGQSDTCPR